VNPILAAGELGLELDTSLVKIGDGTQNWSNLDYISAGFNADFVPTTPDSYDIGSNTSRVQDIWTNNLYTGDINLSNEGRTNDVDGTCGSWTIQEGDTSLFLINRKSGDKFRILMEKVQ
jgi:hypothetical protein